MKMDIDEISTFLCGGKLTALPAKEKKKLAALLWLTEFLVPEWKYSESELNRILNELHTFGDPALLRRELYDHGLIERSPDGSEYRLTPLLPTLEELRKKFCGIEAKPKAAEPDEAAAAEPDRPEAEITPQPKVSAAVMYNASKSEIAAAAEFRSVVHADALERLQRIHPDITEVVDRYGPEDYFQQYWDYPGKWYTIVAVPESCGGRENLINTIVRDTLAKYRK